MAATVTILQDTTSKIVGHLINTSGSATTTVFDPTALTHLEADGRSNIRRLHWAIGASGSAIVKWKGAVDWTAAVLGPGFGAWDLVGLPLSNKATTPTGYLEAVVSGPVTLVMEIAPTKNIGAQ